MYSFKRDAEVFLVSGTRQYNIDISDISFNQDIDTSDKANKTIQEAKLFKDVIIGACRPAEFSFTFPALRESDFQVVFDKSLSYGTFDLYVRNKSDLFKIEYGVITNMSILISKNKPLAVDIKGEASKIYRVGDASTAIPGTVEARSSTRTYNRITIIDVTIGGVPPFESFTAASIELQNQIKWKPFKTILDACIPGTQIVCPTEWTLDKRILSGSLSSYKLENILWNSNTSLTLEVGQDVLGTVYGFKLILDNITFTSRLNTGQIFTQSYDWRLTQNPESLLELVSYITTAVGDSHAILDAWGESILDTNNLPILDSL